jgi:hypothetical protein
MPLNNPIGKAISKLPKVKHNVPTIAGSTPPRVIPCEGGSVMKEKFNTWMPCQAINPTMTNRMSTTAALSNRNKVKKNSWLIFFITSNVFYCVL